MAQTPAEITADAIRLWNNCPWSQLKDPQLLFSQTLSKRGIDPRRKLDAADLNRCASIAAFLRDWANGLEGKPS